MQTVQPATSGQLLQHIAVANDHGPFVTSPIGVRATASASIAPRVRR